MTTQSGPAVARDATAFKNGATRQPSEDERLRQVADQKLLDLQMKRSATFQSLETGDPVELSLALVKSVVSVPTRSGALPDDKDCFKFMKLCEARRLNPLVGDAYLIGYDQRAPGNTTVPVFNIIVAHSALLKRAEMSPHFRGMESGVIVVMKKDVGEHLKGDIVELHGDFYLHDRHELVGAWARVKRDDRDVDIVDRLNRSVFDTEVSRWAKDPAGMIVKCAEASVLRTAFPGETAGLYIREELEHVQRSEASPRQFDVADIDEHEDRLAKQSSGKKPAAVKPAAVKPESPAAAEQPTKGRAAQKPAVQPAEEAVAVAEVHHERVDDQVDDQPAEQADDQVDEQPVAGGLFAEPSGALDDIAEFRLSIAATKQIRTVRALRDEFTSSHNLSEDQMQAVVSAAKQREDAIRAELAS